MYDGPSETRMFAQDMWFMIILMTSIKRFEKHYRMVLGTADSTELLSDNVLGKSYSIIFVWNLPFEGTPDEKGFQTSNIG